MTRVHKRYSETVAYLTKDIEKRSWNVEWPSIPEIVVKLVKKMLIEALDEYCDFGLYTLQYLLLDHMVEKIRRSIELSNLHISLY